MLKPDFIFKYNEINQKPMFFNNLFEFNISDIKVFLELLYIKGRYRDL